jgi:hypothetical protein
MWSPVSLYSIAMKVHGYEKPKQEGRRWAVPGPWGLRLGTVTGLHDAHDLHNAPSVFTLRRQRAKVFLDVIFLSFLMDF